MFRVAPIYTILVIKLVAGLETGAPPAACESMTPRHVGLEPEPLSQCPFELTQSQIIYGNSTESITVTLAANSGSDKSFRGFLVEVSHMIL